MSRAVRFASDPVVLGMMVERYRRDVTLSTTIELADSAGIEPSLAFHILRRLIDAGAVREVRKGTGRAASRFALTDRAVRLLGSTQELPDG